MEYTCINVTRVDSVTVVRFTESHILNEMYIQRCGRELLCLVDVERTHQVLLSFEGVKFLSSIILSKLLTLNKKIKAQQGQLVLCDMDPEVEDLFSLTNLSRLFDIRDTQTEALATFS